MRVIGNSAYDYIRDLVHHHSRIHLGPEKKALVTARLGKRLSELGLQSFEEYCSVLRADLDGREVSILLDLITTNFTHFFRETKHFDFIRTVVLPDWNENNRFPNAAFRLWSAGCSTGEEAYSMGITLAEFFEPHSMPHWEIVATDISSRVLHDASQGIYRASQVKKIPISLLRKYFRKGINQWEGHFRVKPTLRSKIHFHHSNLFSHQDPFKHGFNVIVCRNVMIYFNQPTQQDLFEKLNRLLLPGGFLIVGHSEGLSSIKHHLKRVSPSVYQKPH